MSRVRWWGQLRWPDWLVIAEVAVFFGLGWLLVSLVGEHGHLRPRDVGSTLGCTVLVGAVCWAYLVDIRHGPNGHGPEGGGRLHQATTPNQLPEEGSSED